MVTAGVEPVIKTVTPTNFPATNLMTLQMVEAVLPVAARLGLPALVRRCENFLVRIIVDAASDADASDADASDAASDADASDADASVGSCGSILKALHLALKHGVEGVGEKAVEMLERKSLPQKEEDMNQVTLEVLWFILKKTSLLRYV